MVMNLGWIHETPLETHFLYGSKMSNHLLKTIHCNIVDQMLAGFHVVDCARLNLIYGASY